MFQAKHGLKIDGWAGEVTKALLGAVTQGFKIRSVNSMSITSGNGWPGRAQRLDRREAVLY